MAACFEIEADSSTKTKPCSPQEQFSDSTPKPPGQQGKQVSIHAQTYIKFETVFARTPNASAAKDPLSAIGVASGTLKLPFTVDFAWLQRVLKVNECGPDCDADACGPGCAARSSKATAELSESAAYTASDRLSPTVSHLGEVLGALGAISIDKQARAGKDGADTAETCAVGSRCSGITAVETKTAGGV